MTDGPVTLLCTGDIHLGRHPSRIPEHLDGHVHSPKSVWHQTVDIAIREDVTALLISGDVIDRANRYYEAYGAFEDGISKLADADIPAVLVSGNHDYDTLPQLVDGIDSENITLLGAGGTWERKIISEGGEPRLAVHGWSFPAEHVHTSPLRSYELDDEAVPTVGLLHADYGVEASDYAPVTQDALTETDVDTWLLGHIHAPTVLREHDPTVLYPGSPQPLDPGEQGSHGPRRVVFSPSGDVTVDPVSLATVRYDSVSVDVTGIESTTALPNRVQSAIRTSLEQNSTGLEVFLPRVTLRGETPIHGELVEQRERAESDLEFSVMGVRVVVDRLLVETVPEIDLESHAGTETPVGHLATLLLELDEEGQSTEHADLLEEAMTQAQEAYYANAYEPLRTQGHIGSPDEETVRRVLKTQANRVLHELLDQQGEVSR